MPTKKEILDNYTAQHDTITEAYYVDKTMDYATFKAAHDGLQTSLDTDMINEGYRKRVWQYTLEIDTDIAGLGVTPITFLSDTKLSISNLTTLRGKFGDKITVVSVTESSTAVDI